MSLVASPGAGEFQLQRYRTGELCQDWTLTQGQANALGRRAGEPPLPLSASARSQIWYTANAWVTMLPRWLELPWARAYPDYRFE